MLEDLPAMPEHNSGMMLHPLLDTYSYLLNEQMAVFANVTSEQEAWDFLDFHVGITSGKYRKKIKGYQHQQTARNKSVPRPDKEFVKQYLSELKESKA